jgi:hypothetical protein
MWLKLLKKESLIKSKENKFNRLYRLTKKASSLKIKILENLDND